MVGDFRAKAPSLRRWILRIGKPQCRLTSLRCRSGFQGFRISWLSALKSRIREFKVWGLKI